MTVRKPRWGGNDPKRAVILANYELIKAWYERRPIHGNVIAFCNLTSALRLRVFTRGLGEIRLRKWAKGDNSGNDHGWCALCGAGVAYCATAQVAANHWKAKKHPGGRYGWKGNLRRAWPLGVRSSLLFGGTLQGGNARRTLEKEEVIARAKVIARPSFLQTTFSIAILIFDCYLSQVTQLDVRDAALDAREPAHCCCVGLLECHCTCEHECHDESEDVTCFR